MEIKLLSAGAVKPGLAKVIDAFKHETGHGVEVAFATAPAIRQRLNGGETIDLVVAPPELLADIARTGNILGDERSTVGRIGVGVMVRDGAPVPRIATVDDFKESLLDTESVVYNQASTGIYLENLFDRLGISTQLKAKSTRYPDFAAVRDHVAHGKGSEIGLGATTVIVESESKGVKFVGPLPAEIQNYTTYAATVIADSPAGEAAMSLLRYLTSAKAKTIFTSTGIE
jgi:molybdate transport system substrate-binding protein